MVRANQSGVHQKTIECRLQRASGYRSHSLSLSRLVTIYIDLLSVNKLVRFLVCTLLNSSDITGRGAI